MEAPQDELCSKKRFRIEQTGNAERCVIDSHTGVVLCRCQNPRNAQKIADALEAGSAPPASAADGLKHAAFLRRYLLRQGCEFARTPDEVGIFDAIDFLESISTASVGPDLGTAKEAKEPPLAECVNMRVAVELEGYARAFESLAALLKQEQSDIAARQQHKDAEAPECNGRCHGAMADVDCPAHGLKAWLGSQEAK